MHDGFANALKLDCTTADTSIAAAERFFIEYPFEGQDLQQFKKGTSDAEDFMVSFYAKANGNFTYVCGFYDADNNRTVSRTFSVTSSWQRFTINFGKDTTGAFDDDNALSLQLRWYLHVGSNYTGGTLQTSWDAVTNNETAGGMTSSFFSSTDNDFYLTGVQLEVGSQATPFEHRSLGEELQLCKRYFHKTGGTAYCNVATVTNFTSGAMLGPFNHPVEMRSAPSVTKSGNWAVLGGDTTVNQTAVSSDSNGKVSEIGFQSGSGGTSGRSATLRFNNDADAYLHWDAEL